MDTVPSPTGEPNLDSATAAPVDPAERVRTWELRALVLIFVVHLAYAGAFIHRSSFLIGDRRVYCLFDDAVISMEYAKNWALGHGPVWNVGERVEGYSNLLWTAVMVLVHLTTQDPSTDCLIMQVIGEGVLLAGLALTWPLGRACGLSPAGRILAVALLAAHYVTNYWTLQGMETGMLACVVSASMIFLARAVRDGTTGTAGLLILSVAPLIRPEGVLLLGFAVLWLFACAKRKRVQTALLAVAALLPTLIHLWWRHGFYGEWLPNTYYLKVTGLSAVRRFWVGLHFTGLTLGHALCLWVVVSAGLFYRPMRQAGMLLSMFALLAAYQWWVGGDAWERDRFVLPVLPGLIVGCSYYVTRFARVLPGSWPLQTGCVVAFGVVAVFNFNYAYVKEALLIKPPLHVKDNEENVRRALAVKEFTAPDATVAASWAGVPPYFADRTGVDLLGKNDKHIARLPASPLHRAPGHNKWDVSYSLDQRKPDVIAARRLEIFRDQPGFNLYNRFYALIGGKETYFWARYDSQKVYTAAMYRTPKQTHP